MSDHVPIEEWASECLFIASLIPIIREEAKGNRVRTGRLAIDKRPETGWANHEQGESQWKLRGGPNSSSVKWREMTCG